MGAHFLKGHIDLPTTDEPGQDLVWGSRLVGAKQRSGLELAIGVADEYLADGNCGHTVVIPDRRIRADWSHPELMDIFRLGDVVVNG